MPFQACSNIFSLVGGPGETFAKSSSRDINSALRGDEFGAANRRYPRTGPGDVGDETRLAGYVAEVGDAACAGPVVARGEDYRDAAGAQVAEHLVDLVGVGFGDGLFVFAVGGCYLWFGVSHMVSQFGLAKKRGPGLLEITYSLR